MPPPQEPLAIRRPRLTHQKLAALAAAATLSAAVCGWATPALACKCAALTPADAYKGADAVFEGRVLQVEGPAPGTEGAAAVRRARMQIVRAWKGVQNEQLDVVTPAESAACGYEFAADESYFVYAVERDGHLNVGSCSRTRKIADAEEDVAALGMGATPVDPRGGAGIGAIATKPAQAQPRPRGGCASCALAGSETTAPYGALLFLCAAIAARRVAAICRRRSGSRS